MAASDETEQARALGRALAELRRRAGLSQAEAGRRAGLTGQGWGLYETGRRAGLFRPDLQRRLTAAVDATAEDLMLEVGAPAGGVSGATALAEKGSFGFSAPPSWAQGLVAFTVTDDSLAPWAASGVVLMCDPKAWPRQGQGCVATFADGRREAGVYAGADEAIVRFGPAGRPRYHARSDISEIWAVKARVESG